MSSNGGTLLKREKNVKEFLVKDGQDNELVRHNQKDKPNTSAWTRLCSLSFVTKDERRYGTRNAVDTSQVTVSTLSALVDGLETGGNILVVKKRDLSGFCKHRGRRNIKNPKR